MGNIKSKVLSSSSVSADGADFLSGEDFPFNISFASDELPSQELNKDEDFPDTTTLTT